MNAPAFAPQRGQLTTPLELGGARRRCTCGNPAELSCCYPVKREGKPSTCGRPLCSACRVLMPISVCCLAHARVLGAKA
jgi:hypothetical protein